MAAAERKPLVLSKEEEAQLKPHADKWIALTCRTAPQTDAEKAQCTDATIRFYATLNLPTLDKDWVIYVRSPIEGRFVSGLLAAGWHLHLEADKKNWPMERLLELREFCKNIPTDPKRDLSQFVVRPYSPAKTAKESGLGEWGIECVRVAQKMFHGGNMSVSSEAFVSFFYEVVKVHERYGIDFKSWLPWEESVKLGGPRFLHERFAVISDFPELLSYDDQNRPHGDRAPHMKWRDGCALYYAHGVQIPAWIIEKPEELTGAKILAESNAEVRRVMMEMMTPAKFIQDVKAEVVHEDKDGLGFPRRLLKINLAGDEPLVMIEVTNSTPEPDGEHRLYHLRVDPNAYGGRASRECLAAIASTWREKAPGTPLMFKKPEDYKLAIET